MNQAVAQPTKASGGLRTFERYLSLSVALCMVAGVVIGKVGAAAVAGLRGLGFGKGSQINAPIAVLIWLMITPMMMKVDFSSVRNVGKRPAGLLTPKALSGPSWSHPPGGTRSAGAGRSTRGPRRLLAISAAFGVRLLGSIVTSGVLRSFRDML